MLSSGVPVIQHDIWLIETSPCFNKPSCMWWLSAPLGLGSKWLTDADWFLNEGEKKREKLYFFLNRDQGVIILHPPSSSSSSGLPLSPPLTGLCVCCRRRGAVETLSTWQRNGNGWDEKVWKVGSRLLFFEADESLSLWDARVQETKPLRAGLTLALLLKG